MFCPLLAQGMISLTWTGGQARVRFAAGQKVVPSPAVSSAMCRMWVIFKEVQVLAVGHRAPAGFHGRVSRWSCCRSTCGERRREGSRLKLRFGNLVHAAHKIHWETSHSRICQNLSESRFLVMRVVGQRWDELTCWNVWVSLSLCIQKY